MTSLMKILGIFFLISTLSACSTSFPSWSQATNSKPLADQEKSAEIYQIQKAVEKLPLKVVKVPTLTGIGFAAVSVQPGKTTNQKRILAIKAARLDALAKLTEQIHGIQLSGSTKIAEAVIQNDTLRADIQGIILGARTVKVHPSTSDTYQVIVEIDKSMIDAIVRAYG